MNSKGKGLGLFSRLSRKSISDLSEWNKNDERLMQCVEQTNLKEIISLVKKKKVCSTKLDRQGHSALHVAAMRNKYDVVQLLIAYSANVTAVDFQGRTALHCAARHGASEVLEVLSHSKDDDWPRDESQMTALHHACIGGDLDCVINLIRKYPMDVEAGDEDGRTPLFYCAQIGHLPVCKELLDRGAIVNVQDKFGRTPLMCAAENGNKLIAELFVKKGADVSLCDSLGRTASWHAMDAGHTAVKQTIDPSPPLTTKAHHHSEEANFPSRQRVHSPILEESESVIGDEETLLLRFRSRNSGPPIREGDTDSDVIDNGLDGVYSDDDFKGSTLSDSDGDGSISPRLCQLSYTMSQLQEDSSITYNSSSLHHMSQSSEVDGANETNMVSAVGETLSEEFPLDILELASQPVDPNKPLLVTDIDADLDLLATTNEANAEHSENSLSCKEEQKLHPKSKLVQHSDSLAANTQVESADVLSKEVKATRTSPPAQQLDILDMSDGISLSSDDADVQPSEQEPPATAELNETQSDEPITKEKLEKDHAILKTNYESLKVEYDDMLKRISDLEVSRRHSQEEQEVNERMDMLIQLSELSSQLDDEQTKNRQLQAQVTTLENLAGGGGSKAAVLKHGAELEQDNWLEYAEEDDDSDDEFGFPGVCLLNNATGKQGKEEVKPVAKVSGRQRQISLKEENREIAKLKAEIESLELQKLSLTEALTQTQSKYAESEHMRKKLLSDLDVSKTTVEVKSQEASKLLSENTDLKQQVTKYKDRSITTVEHAKTYKKEVERLNKKLELYDREYRKVKERLKRKDANERRMLKDRQSLMKKADEAVRRLKESEKGYEEMRLASHAEADELMVRCEELESELVVLKDFNEDQSYEMERLTDLIDCGDELLQLKQQEVESLEKQISLLREVTPSSQNDIHKDSQATIRSLHDQITKLQEQLAETASSYQETIDIYRNNLILASKNLLDPDVKEALLHIIETRKL